MNKQGVVIVGSEKGGGSVIAGGIAGGVKPEIDEGVVERVADADGHPGLGKEEGIIAGLGEGKALGECAKEAGDEGNADREWFGQRTGSSSEAANDGGSGELIERETPEVISTP